ncbi:MAG: L-fucose:H+ symporter permease [Gammaproteobacteria bacterium]|nr:L-fucose:H+ symporter permease [Gammaproteobacteria bacterium]MDE1984381.1 L-fucose:H+ symporter permease [Gammaproteobacteria bacterium]MDE2109065.1 L-fucose:H+ symporter permease [Gammaproteobacteria bacterium]
MNKNRLAFGVVSAVFFMWGFITVLNDVLVPHLKTVFALDYTETMLIQFTFFGAYFLMSLPSGKVVSLWGYKNSIIIGLAVTGIGALLFYPAAALRYYGLFLAALFVLASGITLLQVAANPYVSLLGPVRTASSRLNLAQALNSLGTTLAPKFGGLLILSGAVLSAAELAKLPAAQQLAYRLQEAHAVQGPYIGIAIALFALALIVYLFHLPAVSVAENRRAEPAHPFRAALRHRHLLFGVVAIFLYVGAEVSIGSFMINYISLPGIGNMPEVRAAGFVSLYWGGAMLGRFIGSALLQRVDPRKLLGSFACVAALLVIATMASHGMLALWSVVSIGLFNSIMFPNIFTLGIEGLGPLTGRGSSLLIMAIVGGAIIPELQGMLADHIGVHHAFLLPLLCYLYIVFYGFKGSKLDVEKPLIAPMDSPARA